MCGIAGVTGSDDIVVMERMLEVIRHRGPDDHGVKRFAMAGRLRQAVLGHQRLSIIDLSPSGHQPMCNEDRSVWIVFNGEIYNFGDLRPELETRGHRFASRTDTEVIVHAYEEWGAACVDRFNGMFAFAILDLRQGTLLLARDRLGIKPLYYVDTGDGLLFASEIKALLEHPRVSREVDIEALDDYLTLGYVPGPSTMFKGVRRVQPGTIVCYDGTGVSEREYWTLPDHHTTPGTDEERVHAYHDLLVDSVRRQLISDVPLGAFLSGGLDSSTIVAIMARELGVERVKTFCVGFGGQTTRHDERGQAMALAAWLGTEHEEVVCSEQDAIAGLPSIVWHLDEPTAEDVLAPYLALCRLARNRVTVALTGEGSDEFAYGYRFYGLEQIRKRWQYVPAFVRRAVAGAARHVYSPNDLRARAAEYCLRDNEVDAFLTWSTVISPAEKSMLYGDAIRSQRPARDLRQWLHGLSGFKTDRGVDLVAWLESRQRLVDFLLLRTDRMSMAVGLEARVPFLDHRLVEFLAGVPVRQKIRGFTGKMILRNAFAGVLPAASAWRRKKPFAAPVSRWIEAAARTYLKDSRLVADGLLRNDGIAATLEAKNADPKRYENQVWAIVMLEVWYRTFVRQEIRKPDPATVGCPIAAA